MNTLVVVFFMASCALLVGRAVTDVVAFVHQAREGRVKLSRSERLLHEAQGELESLRRLLESAVEDGRLQVRVPLERELEARRAECLRLTEELVREREKTTRHVSLLERLALGPLDYDLSYSKCPISGCGGRGSHLCPAKTTEKY